MPCHDVLSHTMYGPNYQANNDDCGTDEQEDGGARAKEVLLPQSDGVGKTRHSRLSSEVKDPVWRRGIEVECRARISEVRGKRRGGRGIVGIEWVESVGRRGLDESHIADEGGPSTSRGDRVHKLGPEDGDHRQGGTKLKMKDDIAEAGCD